MGLALCLLSAAGFSTLSIFGTYVYGEDVNVITLLAVRFALAATVFWAIALASGAHRQIRATPPPVRRRALALGGVGYTMQAGAFFLALERLDPSLLALLLYTYPAMVTIAALLLGRDRATPQRTAALFAASAGVALVLVGAGVGGGFDALGVLLGITAAATYTTYILVSDTIIDDIEPVALSTLVLSGSAVTLAVVGVASGGLDLHVGAAAWGWLLCLALASTVLPVLSFFAGLRRVGPSTASILSTFEPVMTIALAFACFGDRLSPVQLAGGSLVLAAVVILQAGVRRQQAPDTEALPV